MMPHIDALPATTSLPSRRRWLAVLLAVCGLLVACEQGAVDSAQEDTEQRLVGTWVRDYYQEGAHVRRLLVLGPDGQFTESAEVVDPAGVTTTHQHAGRWLYDGMNLKRHYTSFDGKQPASPVLPYATFQVRFDTNREFIGIDNVRRREVRYQRVADGSAL